jgi:hypothetical protein
MVVAAMQVQEKEIADLRRALELAHAGTCRQPIPTRTLSSSVDR